MDVHYTTHHTDTPMITHHKTIFLQHFGTHINYILHSNQNSCIHSLTCCKISFVDLICQLLSIFFSFKKWNYKSAVLYNLTCWLSVSLSVCPLLRKLNGMKSAPLYSFLGNRWSHKKRYTYTPATFYTPAHFLQYTLAYLLQYTLAYLLQYTSAYLL